MVAVFQAERREFLEIPEGGESRAEREVVGSAAVRDILRKKSLGSLDLEGE